jgi:hypothetical protein
MCAIRSSIGSYSLCIIGYAVARYMINKAQRKQAI